MDLQALIMGRCQNPRSEQNYGHHNIKKLPSEKEQIPCHTCNHRSYIASKNLSGKSEKLI